ncbi:MAG: TlpA disulfide reductase family protein [Polyangiales bacterium]|nr:TlpA family protein disulfide reductase [Sandaracinus sp.]
MDRLHPLIAVCCFVVLACDDPTPPPAGALRGVGVTARVVDDDSRLEGFCDVHHAKGAGPVLTPPPGAASQGARWWNVWATWCAPCVEELPRMARFVQTLEGEGLPVTVGYVSADATDEAVASFRRRHPNTPESGRLSDLEQLRGWLPTVGLDQGAPLPVHVFVGEDGKVRCARAGGVGEDDLEAIRAALR